MLMGSFAIMFQLSRIRNVVCGYCPVVCKGNVIKARNNIISWLFLFSVGLLLLFRFLCSLKSLKFEVKKDHKYVCS